MPPKKGKGEEDLVSCLISSEEFKTFIRVIVQEEMQSLTSFVKELKEEVSNLRESNIQLIHLLTENNTNPHVQKCLQIKSATNKKNYTSEISNPEITKIDTVKSNNSYPTKTAADKDNNLKTNNNKNESDTQKNLSRYNKKKRTNVIVGNAKQDRSEGKLIGVEKKAYLHICKFKNNDASTEDLIEYLKNDIDVEKVECEKFKTYYGGYTYFKLGIPPQLLDTLYKSDYWPEGVEISKHLFRSNRNSSEPFSRTKERDNSEQK